MAHIIILGTLQDQLEELHVYSEAVANGTYHGNRLIEAEALVESVENLSTSVAQDWGSALDARITELKDFLGI